MDGKRCAIVTGANKGLGLEVCRQLAATGIKVILTARDKKRGLEAMEKLKGLAGDDITNIIFHHLDVADPSTITPLVDFVKDMFGKLDILINNAGILGSKVDWESLQGIIGKPGWTEDKLNELIDSQTYEMAEECIQVNYYGTKKMIEAFVPLLQLSDSPRILNVSSVAGKLEYLSNEWAKGVLNDVDNLTEERIDEVVKVFLNDFKDGTNLETKCWPKILSSYIVSKVALNAYTRVIAKKFLGILVNCACPGYVKTDINENTGLLSVEEGAENLVRVALLPDDGPSGAFFQQAKLSSFE
ncbi:(+)-neomenthol dehydrogenase-like isoform X1 [Impatiens glandulifera]|uniref:(+)-neomenthol dehydrogenase-like isoform X1 n=1 Tax=Impatiens glandulifera TaxID=253017 RepID=UPI001FB07379|nr:(+)-neomenthol dehydrogenase-like isoform X1 [Impatiens glandulifera]